MLGRLLFGLLGFTVGLMAIYLGIVLVAVLVKIFEYSVLVGVIVTAICLLFGVAFWRDA